MGMEGKVFIAFSPFVLAGYRRQMFDSPVGLLAEYLDDRDYDAAMNEMLRDR